MNVGWHHSEFQQILPGHSVVEPSLVVALVVVCALAKTDSPAENCLSAPAIVFAEDVEPHLFDMLRAGATTEHYFCRDFVEGMQVVQAEIPVVVMVAQAMLLYWSVVALMVLVARKSARH